MVRIKVVVEPPSEPESPSPAPSAGGAPVTELIVPLDGSKEAERVVPLAASLASITGAHLHLLTTVDDLPELSPSAYLEQVAARIEGATETEVALDQDPVAAIVEHASRPEVAVVMATHARGRLSSALRPDVASAVVAAAQGPVVLVGPACDLAAVGDGPVLIAHDGTDPCTAASRPLVAFAAALRRPIEVVRVASAPSVIPTEHPYADTDGRIAPLLALATELGIEGSERIVFGTHVHDEVLKEATRVGASMIAMATHKRSRRDRFVHPSSTIAVVHDATVPVVAHHLDL